MALSTESGNIFQNKMFLIGVAVFAVVVMGILGILFYYVFLQTGDQQTSQQQGQTTTTRPPHHHAAELKVAPKVLQHCNVEIAKLPDWGTISETDRNELAAIKLPPPLQEQFKDLTRTQIESCPILIEEAKAVKFLEGNPPSATAEMKVLINNHRTRLSKYETSIVALMKTSDRPPPDHGKIGALTTAISENKALDDGSLNLLKSYIENADSIPADQRAAINNFIDVYNKVQTYKGLADSNSLSATDRTALSGWLDKYDKVLGLSDVEKTKLKGFSKRPEESQTAAQANAIKDENLTEIMKALKDYKVFDKANVEERAQNVCNVLSKISDLNGPDGIVLQKSDTKDLIINHAVEKIRSTAKTHFEESLKEIKTAVDLGKLKAWFQFVRVHGGFTDAQLEALDDETKLNAHLSTTFKSIIDEHLQKIYELSVTSGTAIGPDQFNESVNFVKTIKSVLGAISLNQPILDNVDDLTADKLVKYIIGTKWHDNKMSAVKNLIGKLAMPPGAPLDFNELVIKQNLDSLNKNFKLSGTSFDEELALSSDPPYNGMMIPAYTPDNPQDFLTKLAKAMLLHRYKQSSEATDINALKTAIQDYLKLRPILVAKLPNCIAGVAELAETKPEVLFKTLQTRQMIDGSIDSFINKMAETLTKPKAEMGMIEKIKKLQAHCKELMDVKKSVGDLTCTAPNDVKCEEFNKIKVASGVKAITTVFAVNPMTASFNLYYLAAADDKLWSQKNILGGRNAADLITTGDVKARYQENKDNQGLLEIQLKYEYVEALKKLIAMEPTQLTDYMKVKDAFIGFMGMATILAPAGYHESPLTDADFTNIDVKRSAVEDALFEIVHRKNVKVLLDEIRKVATKHNQKDTVIKFVNAVSQKPGQGNLDLLGDLIENKHLIIGFEVLKKEAELAIARCAMLHSLNVAAAAVTDTKARKVITDYINDSKAEELFKNVMSERHNLTNLSATDLKAMEDCADKMHSLASYYTLTVDFETMEKLIDEKPLNALKIEALVINSVVKLLTMDKKIRGCPTMAVVYVGYPNEFNTIVFNSLNTVKPADAAGDDAIKAIYEYAHANFNFLTFVQADTSFISSIFSSAAGSLLGLVGIKTPTAQSVLKDAKQLRRLALEAQNPLLMKADLKLYYYNKQLIDGAKAAFNLEVKDEARIKDYATGLALPKWAQHLLTMEDADFSTPQKANSVFKAAAKYFGAHMLYEKAKSNSATLCADLNAVVKKPDPAVADFITYVQGVPKLEGLVVNYLAMDLYRRSDAEFKDMHNTVQGKDLMGALAKDNDPAIKKEDNTTDDNNLCSPSP